MDPPHPQHLCRQMATLHGQVTQSLQLTVEQELLEIFAPADHSRNRRIVAAYCGWEGGRRVTLEELGRKIAISRERVRQVCLRAIKQHRERTIFARAWIAHSAFVAAASFPGDWSRSRPNSKPRG